MERLNSRDMMDGMLKVTRAIGGMGDAGVYYEASNDLSVRAKMFEALVWYPTLQKMVNSCFSRGMSGELRGMKVMTWCCAGRCLIQFEEGDATLVLITADDEAPWRRENCHVAPFMGPMGVQHVDGEYHDLLKMLYKAMRYGNELDLKPDNDVSI